MLSLISSVFSAIGGLFSWAVDRLLYRAGENAQANKDLGAENKIDRAELDAAANAPTSKADLDKRLDEGSF